MLCDPSPQRKEGQVASRLGRRGAPSWLPFTVHPPPFHSCLPYLGTLGALSISIGLACHWSHLVNLGPGFACGDANVSVPPLHCLRFHYSPGSCYRRPPIVIAIARRQSPLPATLRQSLSAAFTVRTEYFVPLASPVRPPARISRRLEPPPLRHSSSPVSRHQSWPWMHAHSSSRCRRAHPPGSGPFQTFRPPPSSISRFRTYWLPQAPRIDINWLPHVSHSPSAGFILQMKLMARCAPPSKQPKARPSTPGPGDEIPEPGHASGRNDITRAR